MNPAPGEYDASLILRTRGVQARSEMVYKQLDDYSSVDQLQEK